MIKNVLEVDNLTIQYNNTDAPVIKNLSFIIKEGETVCLSGPSGIGKSTVVWAIMDMLDEYDAFANGTIRFLDKEMIYNNNGSNKSFGWENVALVPQASMGSFNPLYTMKRSFEEMLSIYKPQMSKEERWETMVDLLNQVCLDKNILLSYPHELSGGMKQRAAIAMAIMLHPKLLILDEATTGLDLVIQAEVLATILRLKKQENMSILFISHDKNLATHFADRSVYLS